MMSVLNSRTSRILSIRAAAMSVATAFALSACGGGSTGLHAAPPLAPGTTGSAGSYGLTASATRAGSVTIPSGVAITASSLVAVNSVGQVPVTSNATFTMQTISNDPQYTEVRNAAGTALLVGWLGAQEPTISAHTTAEAYVYFGTGAYTIADATQRQAAQTSIQTLPGLSTLETAITAALAKNPAVAPATDVGVQTALTSLIASIATTSPASAHRIAAEAFRLPASLSFSPGASGSGIQIVPSTVNGTDNIAFQNSLRRGAIAFVDDISHVDSTTKQTVTDNPIDTAAPVPILAVSGIGSFGGAISDYLRGNYSLVPTTTEPVPVPNVAGAKSTLYRVAVVGVGGVAGDFAKLTKPEADKYLETVNATFIYEVILPLAATLLVPIGKGTATVFADPHVNAAVKDVVTALAASGKIKEVAEAGKPEEMLSAIVALAASNASLFEPIEEALINTLTLANVAAGAPAAAEAETEHLFGPLALADAGIATLDVLAVIKDTTFVNKADIYMITATDPTTTLVTQSANPIAPGTAITFLAGVHPPETDPVVYQYTNTANFGHLTDATGSGHLDNFTSSSATVTYTANATGGGSDTITVTPKVLVNGLSTNIKSLAVASASITVSGPTSGPIVASSISLSPGPCTYFGNGGGTQVFTVSAVTNAPPGTLEYGWLNSYDVGTLSVPGQTHIYQSGEPAIIGQSTTASITSPAFPIGSVSGGGGGIVVTLFVSLPPFFEDALVGGANSAQVKLAGGAITCP